MMEDPYNNNKTLQCEILKKKVITHSNCQTKTKINPFSKNYFKIWE